jgi:hypothetical protein
MLAGGFQKEKKAKHARKVAKAKEMEASNGEIGIGILCRKFPSNSRTLST